MTLIVGLRTSMVPGTKRELGRCLDVTARIEILTKFYLNIRDGETLTRDPKPYRFSNAQVARDTAIQAVRDFLGAHPAVEAFNEKRIEIADETGHPIAIVDAQDVHPVAPDTDNLITG